MNARKSWKFLNDLSKKVTSVLPVKSHRECKTMLLEISREEVEQNYPVAFAAYEREGLKGFKSKGARILTLSLIQFYLDAQGRLWLGAKTFPAEYYWGLRGEWMHSPSPMPVEGGDTNATSFEGAQEPSPEERS